MPDPGSMGNVLYTTKNNISGLSLFFLNGQIPIILVINYQIKILWQNCAYSEHKWNIVKQICVLHFASENTR